MQSNNETFAAEFLFDMLYRIHYLEKYPSYIKPSKTNAFWKNCRRLNVIT